MTIQNDLSYFKTRLRELLNTSFPERSGDKRFIDERSELAASTYESTFRAGNSIEQCFATADCVLFEGLYFSKFDTVFQVVCSEFGNLMLDEELRPFAIKMLPKCELVFSKYLLADDFAYSVEYNLLYIELTGTIQIWIEEHGL